MTDTTELEAIAGLQHMQAKIEQLTERVAAHDGQLDTVLQALVRMTSILEDQNKLLARLQQDRDEGMTEDARRRINRGAIEEQLGRLQADMEVMQRQMQVLMPRMSAAENSCRRLETGAKQVESITAGDIMKALAQTPIGRIATERQQAIDKDNALRMEKSAAEARGVDLETYRRDRAEREQTKQARIAAEQARIARMAPQELKLPMAAINGKKCEPFGEDLDD